MEQSTDLGWGHCPSQGVWCCQPPNPHGDINLQGHRQVNKLCWSRCTRGLGHSRVQRQKLPPPVKELPDLHQSRTELDMGPFILTQSNPIQSGCSQLTFNPIHKYLVLNPARKLCASNYSNADLEWW